LVCAELRVEQRKTSLLPFLFSTVLPANMKANMINKLKWLAASALCVGTVGAQAEVSQVRLWAAACATCHSTGGHAQEGNESLAGKDKDEMFQKLMDYKSGRKPATLMHQLTAGYSDEQLLQISAYFAAQKK
jgi:cytochrome c553